MGLKSVQHVGVPRGTVDKTITLNPAPANGDLMIFVGVSAAYFGPTDNSAWTGWTPHFANSNLIDATWAGPVYSKVCDGTETQITWQNPGGNPRAASCAILILDNDVTQILGQNSSGAFGWNPVNLADVGTDTAVNPQPGAGASWTGGLMIRCNGNVFNNDYSAETMDAAGDTVEMGETWVSAIDEDSYLSTFATPMPGGTGTFDLDHTNWTTAPKYYAMNIYLETPTPTLPGNDTTGPVLQSTSPADTATGVAVGTTVSATFDENLGGTPAIALSPAVAGSTNVTGATITFTPSADLDPSTTYTVTVSGIEDALGNTSTNETFSFTTAAAPPALNPTATENAQPGSGDAGFVPTVANGEVGFLGYAKQFSVNAGSTIDFAVDNAGGVGAPTKIAIYRLGGYDFTNINQQNKRLITTIVNSNESQAGTTPTTVDTNAFAMNWNTTASWAVPADMASGMFVAAVRNDADSCGAWIPFIVRNDSRDADIVVKVSDSTWGLAYNYFGGIGSEKTGRSTYGLGDGAQQFTATERVNAVSYDRPIVTRTTVQNHFDQYEMPTIHWLESNGFDVKYISCYDFDQHDPVTNDLLGAAKILIHVGHDEYWSQGMRDNSLAFAQAGGHQVWLTANEVFWRVRWADAGRTMWCYKDTKQDRTDPVSWTGTWRDARWVDNAPEDEVCGTFFRLNGINEETMTLAPGAHQTVPFWRDTAVSAGTGLTLPILGFEVDEVIPKTGGAILAQSDVVAVGNYADDNGEFYNGSATFTWGINMFYPTAGQGVSVGFGSMDWVRWLSTAARDNSGATNTSIRQSMANLLYDLGATADTFDPDAEGLVEPTPVALSTYGIVAPTIPILQDFHVSNGTQFFRLGSAAALEAAADPFTQYALADGTRPVTGAATTAYVDTAVSDKATTTYVDTATGDKATTAYVDSAVAAVPTFLVVNSTQDVPNDTAVNTVVLVPQLTSARVVSSSSVFDQFDAASNIIIPAPVDIQLNDLLIAVIANQTSKTVGPNNELLTIPSGFSRVGWAAYNARSDWGFVAAYAKTATASEPIDYTFAADPQTGPATGVDDGEWGRTVAGILVVRDGSAVSAFAGPSSNPAAGNPPILPTVAVTADETLAIGISHVTSGIGTDATLSYSAAGWTDHQQPIGGDTTQSGMVLASKVYANGQTAGGDAATTLASYTMDVSAVLLIPTAV